MAIQPLYRTGTATVTADSDVVTGTGTAWGLALVNGGTFSAKGRSIPIVGVTDDTHLTLAYPAPADMAGNGLLYAVELGRADVADTIVANRKLADLVDILSNKVSPFARSLFDDATAGAALATLTAQPDLGLKKDDISAFARGLLNDADAATLFASSGFVYTDGIITNVSYGASLKFPNGLIMKWGVDYRALADKTITFANVFSNASQFPNNCLFAFATPGSADDNAAANYSSWVSARSVQSIIVRNRVGFQGAVSAVALHNPWFAIGN